MIFTGFINAGSPGEALDEGYGISVLADKRYFYCRTALARVSILPRIHDNECECGSPTHIGFMVKIFTLGHLYLILPNPSIN